jgi:predicted RNase H-like nuclease
MEGIQWLAGVDGCRGGWVVVREEVASGRRVVEVLSTLEGLARSEVTATFVDIPQGLPNSTPRAADRLAREALRPGRASSVFSAPVRGVLECESYPVALARSRSDSGHGLSIQAWNIVPKIREVDDLLRTYRPAFFECHPEVSFARMCGAPIQESKKSAAGATIRSDLLHREFGARPERPMGCGADDYVDAWACLWTARRWLARTAIVLPDAAEFDDEGVAMQIWV